MKPEPKFKVGQVVIVANSFTRPDLVGAEIEITNLAWVNKWRNGAPSGWGYKSTIVNQEAHEFWEEPSLRPLPDGNQPATFDAAIWQPKREGAGA